MADALLKLNIQGENSMANKQGQHQGPQLQMEIQGPLNKCIISVEYKPNTDVHFFAGYDPGPHKLHLIADDNGVPFCIRTNSYGVGKVEDFDLSAFKGVDKYNSMTAVCPTDLKSSRAHGIPLKVPGESAAAKQTKRLKVDPKDENIVMHRNHYTFSLLTLDEQLKPSSQAVMFDFDWPVNILDKDNNVVRSKTQEYTVQTQANGEGKIYFRLYQRTRGRVGIRLEGVFERLIKTVEYV